jgi:NADH:ubiquinone oxidoreductase subunit F (NADH-binding)
VHYLNTGDARPTTTPPRPSDAGVRARPTLVDNVETLAHLALIARYGPDWFRAVGTPRSPGTTLITVAGAVAHPGVYEIELGTALGDALEIAGGATMPVSAALVGGYGGSWLPLPEATEVALTHEDLRAAGVGFGVALLIALPSAACGLGTTAALLRYLAGQSARQCGPCTFGLPAIADDLTQLTTGRADSATLDRLTRRLEVITGRGACAHPDGAVRLARSALDTFAADLKAHRQGRPCRGAAHPFPLPGLHPPPKTHPARLP